MAFACASCARRSSPDVGTAAIVADVALLTVDWTCCAALLAVSVKVALVSVLGAGSGAAARTPGTVFSAWGEL